MTFDTIPIWLFFVGTILLVISSTEIGYRLGHRSRRRSEEEKESPVSAIAGSVLGLTGYSFGFRSTQSFHLWDRFRAVRYAQRSRPR